MIMTMIISRPHVRKRKDLKSYTISRAITKQKWKGNRIPTNHKEFEENHENIFGFIKRCSKKLNEGRTKDCQKSV